MSHTWGELRTLFLSAAGDAAQATSEVLDHFTFALRDLCAKVDVPELFQPDARQDTIANQDYLDIDVDVYYIQSIVDLSTGHRLDEEPEANMGRSKFLDTNGKPPVGEPQFWMRQGKRIYLRDTPAGVRTLRLQYKFHPAEVTEADLILYPVTPNQYDEPLLWLALAKYYALHPPKLADGTPDYQRSDLLEQRALQRIVGVEDIKAMEGKARNNFVQQMGYNFNLGIGIR